MKINCPNIYDNEITLPGFGLAKIKTEGAPQHPDDYDWEHPPGSGCKTCQSKYDRALKRYLEYENNVKHT